MPWRLKRTTQCGACPWRVATDPHDIPNGYDVQKHAALKETIAEPGSVAGLAAGELLVMACHMAHDAHCLGWLMHQLGPGNNIALRLRVRDCTNVRDVRLVGEQHERFEDTLPADR